MSPSVDLSDVLSLAKTLAIQAGEIAAQKRASNTVEVRFKTGIDLVTSADIAAEKVIIDGVKSRYPAHAILSEESHPSVNEEILFHSPLWIIDPIDGTTNYARNHLQVAVSIAFADQGEVVVGVVHAPFQNETFWAVKGRGAWMNDKPIAVSTLREASLALIGTGFPQGRRRPSDIDLKMRRVRTILENCRDLRRLGSAALDLCWVANGRLDAYFESVNSWDMAAGRLVALEAGARAGFLTHPGPQLQEIPESLYGEEMFVATPGVFEDVARLLRL